MHSTENLLREMDYTTYGQSCRDPHLTSDQQFVECRRGIGHPADTHATRAGIDVIVWEYQA